MAELEEKTTTRYVLDFGELKPLIEQMSTSLQISQADVIRLIIRRYFKRRGLLPKKALSSPMKTLTPKEK